MDTISLLQAAKSTILDYGWIKGDDGSTAAGFCLRGAVRFAGIGDLKVTQTTLNLLDHMCGDCCITDWNDRPVRTQEEVINLIDTCIEHSERLLAAV